MIFYSIYDKDAETFSNPFVAENDAIASRMFVLNTEKLPDVVKSSLELHVVFVVGPDMHVVVNEPLLVMRGTDIPKWISEHSMSKDGE